jgi:RNA polymerase sigma-70 factor (ECF subfamily)
LDKLQVNDHNDLVDLVRRIIERDPRAEEEMIRRYEDGVFQIIYHIVGNHSVAEDLRQDTLLKALEKIRDGNVREPERLSGFVCAIARYIALDYVRKMRSAIKVEDVGAAEFLPDPTPSPYEQVLQKERADIVRRVISEMKIQRDREVLIRYYVLEEDKETVCAALHLTKEQFSRIIFRAHKRYKELHQKLADKIE